jgi:hypothetical protein
MSAPQLVYLTTLFLPQQKEKNIKLKWHFSHYGEKAKVYF